jgi:hypothetical protein
MFEVHHRIMHLDGLTDSVQGTAPGLAQNLPKIRTLQPCKRCPFTGASCISILTKDHFYSFSLSYSYFDYIYYIYTHVYIYIYIYICGVYIYIYMSVYIYIHTLGFNKSRSQLKISPPPWRPRTPPSAASTKELAPPRYLEAIALWQVNEQYHGQAQILLPVLE